MVRCLNIDFCLFSKIAQAARRKKYNRSKNETAEETKYDAAKAVIRKTAGHIMLHTRASGKIDAENK